MTTRLCYREIEIEKVKKELEKRLNNSKDSSIELNMKNGNVYLIGQNNCKDYQVYYVGNRYDGDIDCDLIAECCDVYDLAKFIIARK